MQGKRRQFNRYNDGVVYIYREQANRSSFGARINPTALTDLDLVAKLTFREESKRQQDLEFAEQQSFSLDYKIRTRYINGVDNKCKAVINGYLYDVEHVDATRTEMYIYMQGVGVIA